MAGSKRARAFLNFIFVIVVVGLGLLAVRSLGVTGTSVTSVGTDSASPTPTLIINGGTSPAGSTSPSATTPTATTPVIWELIVLESTGSTQKIVSLNLSTKARKTLYTDADENVKIRQVGNLTSDGREALVLMSPPGDEFGGSLYTVATDGSGRKTLLIDQFASPWPPVFSPDGTKIAYIFFSNAEAEAGFYLVIANRDGTNKRELVREAVAITQPVFSPDGSEIAYFRSGTEAGRGSIMTVGTTGGTSRQILAYADRVPYDLAWAADHTLAFVDGTGDNAHLFDLSRGATEATRLTTPAGAESRPLFAPDSSQLAFGSLAGSTPSILVLDRTTGKTENLGRGSIVVGWRTGNG